MTTIPPEIQALCSQLASSAERAARQASAQRAALAAARAEVEHHGVRLRVGASGELLDFRLTKGVEERSAVTWSRCFMEAYRLACEAANRSTAATITDPGLQRMVLASAPADVLARREERPASAQPRTGTPDETVSSPDGVPPDSSLEQLFAVLESADPLASLAALAEAGEFDMVDLSRPVHEIDAEIRHEMETVASRIDELGPALRRVTAEGRNNVAIVTAGPWGQIERVEFRAVGLREDPEEVSDLLLKAYREATDEAAATLRRLLVEHGLHDETDPTIARLGDKESR